MTVPKRLYDVAASFFGLVLLWPLLLLIAAIIKLDDRGPVLFRQERVGLRGSSFRLLKFRTMRHGPGGGPLLTLNGDPRVTRVGRWLRQLKLDELPQLINVLLGDMSIVGPRPEVSRYVEHYSPEQRKVLAFVPGITDPASIRYWNEGELLARSPNPERTYVREIMPEKLRIQLDYGLESTVWKDFLITVATLRRLWPDARPMLLNPLVRYRRHFILMSHALVVTIAYWAAYALRFDFAIPPAEMSAFLATLPFLLVIRLAIYGAYRLYRGYWQHFGLVDFTRFLRAATLGSAVFVTVLTLLGRFPGVPRSVLLLEWVGTVVLVGGMRIAARSMHEATLFPRLVGRRTFVLGSGDKAERLLREVRGDPNHALRVLGLVVEEPTERDASLHGYRALGTLDQLPTLVRQHRAEFIVIALDAPNWSRMEHIVSRCLEARVEFKTLPSMRELLDGSARADQLRSVRIEDLLGREPVQLQMSAVEGDLSDRVVLITGGAGSIGAELARQVARMRPARLVLVDRAESPLYFTHHELTTANPGLAVVPVIADITDEARIAHVVGSHRPAYVIHAAAYKHVPLMEDHVFEAVRNNLFGTIYVARAAAAVGALKFVLISTDKAVHPSSVMGATKRIAERVVLGLPDLRNSRTDFRAVRFGNVLGSAGSVVPLFERQLEGGGPLTVTHPDVERYFMTIPEAAQLVLQAAALDEAGGRITMLDMGRPIRILDLAETLTRLAGLEPHRDVRIVYTGLRPGEKLHEELMSEIESTEPSGVAKVRIVRAPESGAGLLEGLARMGVALALQDEGQLLTQIRGLVPESRLPLQPRVSDPNWAAPLDARIAV